MTKEDVIEAMKKSELFKENTQEFEEFLKQLEKEETAAKENKKKPLDANQMDDPLSNLENKEFKPGSGDIKKENKTGESNEPKQNDKKQDGDNIINVNNP